MDLIVQGIKILKITFDKYAGKDEDSSTLTKAEAVELIKGEFKFVQTAEVDEFFKTLDLDGDGLVTFQEFMTIIIAFCLLIQE